MADSTLVWAPTAIGVPPGLDAAYEEAWFSWLGLLPDKVIPAVPARYNSEQQEGRVLYVKGFPNLTTPGEVRDFFSVYAEVDRCITVVDMVSKFSFRWVIMANVQDMRRVIWGIQGLVVDDTAENGSSSAYILRACSALGGDRHFLVDPRSTVDRAINGDPIPKVPNEQSAVSCSALALPESSTPEPETEAKSSPDSSAPTDEGAAKTPGIVVTAPHDEFVTQAATWARIAESANPAATVVQLQPPRVIPTIQLRPAEPASNGRNIRGEDVEPKINQMRVVFLLDIPNSLTLQDVSDAVKEGALRSIDFGIEDNRGTRFAAIVFQYAQEAAAFYQVLCKERNDGKPGRFKFIVESAHGEPFLIDETIKAMGFPSFASRRLTLVKSKFFFMFGETQLRTLCEKLVAKDTIQLIWLYNGGNATIVFGDVNAAISVKYALDKMSRGNNIPDGQSAITWAGLSTSFSRDPSVVPLELKVGMTRY